MRFHLSFLIFLISATAGAEMREWNLGSACFRPHSKLGKVRLLAPHPPLTPQIKHSSGVRLISGGNAATQSRPEDLRNGISDGVFPCVVEHQGTEKPALEKIVPFDEMDRQRIAEEFTKLASQKKLGPEYYGYTDILQTDGRTRRHLYTEEMGGSLVVKNSKGEKIRGPMGEFHKKLQQEYPELTKDQIRTLDNQLYSQIKELKSLHPDPNPDNYLIALVADPVTTQKKILVQAVDWDYPMNVIASEVNIRSPGADPKDHWDYKRVIQVLKNLREWNGNAPEPIPWPEP